MIDAADAGFYSPGPFGRQQFALNETSLFHENRAGTPAFLPESVSELTNLLSSGTFDASISMTVNADRGEDIPSMESAGLGAQSQSSSFARKPFTRGASASIRSVFCCLPRSEMK